MSRNDPLSYLLDLDGEILVQEGGYWVKIEAYGFTDAGSLLKDFFAAVDRVLTDKGVI